MKITARGGSSLLSQRDLDNCIVEVGILEDSPGSKPRNKKAGFKSVAGEPARKIKGKSKVMISEVAEKLDEKYNWTGKAINNENRDLDNVIDWVLEVVFTGSERSKRQLLNACRALVRNPILRKEFESNAASTIKQKGFNRPLIDTGTFFSKIFARFTKRK